MNNNQIDFGKIYGIRGMADVPAFTGTVNPNIPSLEQIARYNIAQAEQSRRQLGGETVKTEGVSVIENTQQGSAAPSADTLNADGTLRANTEMTTAPIYGVNTDIATPVTTMNQQIFESAVESSAGVTAVSQNPTTQEIVDFSTSFPVTAESIQYMNGFLRTQIGRRVEIEFLVGTNNIDRRFGTLLGVGANYLLINESETDDITACDFYNIKFVRIFY